MYWTTFEAGNGAVFISVKRFLECKNPSNFFVCLFLCLYLCLFLCLFAWSLSSHTRIFHSYGDVTVVGEGRQILTYAWHSWPLSSEGSLACHTYCDAGNPFVEWSSPRTRDTHTYSWAFSNGIVTSCFYELALSRPSS